MVLLDLSLTNPEKISQDVSHEKKYLCSNCKMLITSNRYLYDYPQKGSSHHFKNSFGFDFNLVTFLFCENIVKSSEAYFENTWFPPYLWLVINCVGCKDHLGWQYENKDQNPIIFYGLIQEKLVLDLHDNK